MAKPNDIAHGKKKRDLMESMTADEDINGGCQVR